MDRVVILKGIAHNFKTGCSMLGLMKADLDEEDYPPTFFRIEVSFTFVFYISTFRKFNVEPDTYLIKKYEMHKIVSYRKYSERMSGSV